MKYISKIDKDFQPIIFEIENARKKYKNILNIMIENTKGYNYSYKLNVSDNCMESYPLVERITKCLLWIVGGVRIYLDGDPQYATLLSKEYSQEGKRNFDREFMEDVYKQPFQIIHTEVFKPAKQELIMAGKHFDGCRIGFDAGGSDWKVSAVVDGKVIFAQEVVWFPKTTKEIDYHFKNIVEAFKLAASKMPRVDAIGVSSAGIYIENKTASASLFRAVDKKDFKRVQSIYLDARDAINPNIPIEVVNDGDVTAIAGSITFNSDCVLGIAMGTSEAGGYVNAQGGLCGWLTELGFVPVSMHQANAVDDWSGDNGTGGSYFSQDAVIRLAKQCGVVFPEDMSLADRLKVVQKMMQEKNPIAYDIFETIGIYLGYTIPFYAEFYEIKKLLVLGRVTSGDGGNLVISTANKILREEFPHLKFEIVTADEEFKRVGQAIAAASLPTIK